LLLVSGGERAGHDESLRLVAQLKEILAKYPS
jgi:hypothetical protein